jgi:hypothetical protein
MESSIELISTKVVAASSESANAIAGLTSTTRKVSKLANDISLKLSNLENIQILVEAIRSASDALAGVATTAGQTNNALASLTAQSGEAESRVREEIVKPLTSLGLASAMQVASQELPDITSKLKESLTGLSSQAALMAVMLNRTKSGLEKSIASATASLGSVEERLIPLDDFVTNARSSVDNMATSVADIKRSILSSAENPPTVRQTGVDGSGQIGAASAGVINRP